MCVSIGVVGHEVGTPNVYTIYNIRDEWKISVNTNKKLISYEIQGGKSNNISHNVGSSSPITVYRGFESTGTNKNASSYPSHSGSFVSNTFNIRFKSEDSEWSNYFSISYNIH